MLDSERGTPWRVDEEIGAAQSLSSRVYHDPGRVSPQVERVFARGWHFAADANRVKAPGHVLPSTLLEGCLDEPLVLSMDDESTCIVSRTCARTVAPWSAREDEEVVQSVQQGVRSRLYDRGRYSPRREVGAHHFHTLLSRFLNGE